MRGALEGYHSGICNVAGLELSLISCCGMWQGGWGELISYFLPPILAVIVLEHLPISLILLLVVVDPLSVTRSIWHNMLVLTALFKWVFSVCSYSQVSKEKEK